MIDDDTPKTNWHYEPNDSDPNEIDVGSVDLAVLVEPVKSLRRALLFLWEIDYVCTSDIEPDSAAKTSIDPELLSAQNAVCIARNRLRRKLETLGITRHTTLFGESQSLYSLAWILEIATHCPHYVATVTDLTVAQDIYFAVKGELASRDMIEGMVQPSKSTAVLDAIRTLDTSISIIESVTSSGLPETSIDQHHSANDSSEQGAPWCSRHEINFDHARMLISRKGFKASAEFLNRDVPWALAKLLIDNGDEITTYSALQQCGGRDVDRESVRKDVSLIASCLKKIGIKVVNRRNIGYFLETLKSEN